MKPFTAYRDITPDERRRLASEALMRMPGLRYVRAGCVVSALTAAALSRDFFVSKGQSIWLGALVTATITAVGYFTLWLVFGEWRMRREIEKLKNE